MRETTLVGFVLALVLVCTGCAEFLESFYGTVGYKIYQNDDDELLRDLSRAPEPSGDSIWTVSRVEPPNHAWNFGLGYRFHPIRVFSDLEFSTLSFDAVDEAGRWRDEENVEVDYFNWGLGAGYQYELPKGFYVALDAKYSINMSSTNYSAPSAYADAFDRTNNTFGLVFTVGYSYVTSIGPVGLNYQIGTPDPIGLRATRIGHQINAEYPGIIGAFVFAGAGMAGAVSQGGGAENWRCASKAQIDFTWPGV